MEKLLALLAKLSKKEMKDFQSYMSKLFTKSDATKLLQYLKKYHPTFGAKQLSESIIHKKVFGDKPFKKQNIAKVAYQLNKELRRFLIWQSDEHTFEKELILLKRYKTLNAPKQVELQLKKMERQVEQDKNNNWYAFMKMRLAHERYFDPRQETPQAWGTTLINAMNSLDDFYIFFKLFYAAEMLSIQQVRNEPIPPIKLLEKVQQLIPESNSINIRAAQLTTWLLQGKEEKIYDTLKHFVIENIDEFSQEHKQVLFTRLLNQISYWIKEGKDFYIKEYFEFLKLGVTSGVFISNGVFHIGHFNNIVDVACKLKELVWLEDFITKTSFLLEEAIREETLIFSQAFIHFGQEAFDKTLALLVRYQPKTAFNKARFWMLSIASNFELKTEEESILNLCQNCNKFVYRNDKITSEMKTNILNFTKMVLLELMEYDD